MLLTFVTLLSIFSANIQVQSISYVGDKEVSLFDISKVNGLSAKDINTLKSIELSKDLSPQTYRSFSKSFMVELIKKLPINKSLKVKLPESAYIVRDTKLWNKENVSLSLKRDLSNQCSDCEINIVLEDIKKIENVVSWTFQISPGVRNQKLYIPVNIQKLDNNKLKTVNIQLVADVYFYKEIPVTKVNINRGERISKEDVELKKILLPSNGQFFSRIEDIIGKKTKRILSQGRTIRFHDLEKNLDVKRGELVRAIVKENNIEINLQVKASESGSVGDVIRVENPVTKKRMHATVTQVSEVEIR